MNVIIEYIGYGLFDARTEVIDVRGVGGSETEATIDLLKNLQEFGLNIDADYVTLMAV